MVILNVGRIKFFCIRVVVALVVIMLVDKTRTNEENMRALKAWGVRKPKAFLLAKWTIYNNCLFVHNITRISMACQ